jgi:hypothetical protein
MQLLSHAIGHLHFTPLNIGATGDGYTAITCHCSRMRYEVKALMLVITVFAKITNEGFLTPLKDTISQNPNRAHVAPSTKQSPLSSTCTSTSARRKSRWGKTETKRQHSGLRSVICLLYRFGFIPVLIQLSLTSVRLQRE